MLVEVTATHMAAVMEALPARVEHLGGLSLASPLLNAGDNALHATKDNTQEDFSDIRTGGKKCGFSGSADKRALVCVVSLKTHLHLTVGAN